MEYKVAEQLGISIISDDKVWARICKIVDELKEQGNDSIVLDFEDVQLMNPWNMQSYINLLGREWVSLVVYTQGEVVKYSDIICNLMMKSKGRVKNIDIIVPVGKSKAQKDFEAKVKLLENHFNKVGNKYVLCVSDAVAYLSNKVTAEALIHIINEKVHDCDAFKIDLTNVSVANDVIKYISDKFIELTCNGVILDVTADENNQELIGMIDTFRAVGIGHRTDDDRAKIIDNELKIGTVGLLAKYKRTRGKDLLGRMGNGEVKSSVVAIYRGRDKNMAHFDTYTAKVFVTAEHYALTNDGEEMEEMPCTKVDVPISELGLFDIMVGSGFHFSMPVQTSDKKMYIAHYIEDEEDEFGEIQGVEKIKKFTLPAYIKYVLDSRRIGYDVLQLQYAISETNLLLGNNNKQK